MAAMVRASQRSAAGRPRGQAMVEFLIVFPVLLLLLLGTFQFALIYQAKITLNYAAFEAARAGSVNNARSTPMLEAFARGMAPIHTHQPGLPASFGLGAAPDYRGLLWGRARLRDQIAAGLVQITVVNPSAASFAEHGIDVAGERRIPNDNLMYRDGRHDNKPLSQQSIQDANLLKIHVGYCLNMVVPFANRILWGMMALAPGQNSTRVNEHMVPHDVRWGEPAAGTFRKSCLDRTQDEYGNAQFFGMPIYAQSIIRMHSDPVQETP